MKIKLLALIALQSIIPLSFAYETGPEIFGKENDMGLCSPTRREEYIKIKKTKLDGKFPNIQRFIIDEDWRTQGLDSDEFPLSEPLIIENPIKGETLAVFDRNYNKTFRVASFFGRSEIRISEQSIFQGRLGGRSTTGSNDVTSLGLLTNDGSYIVVNGCDGVFDVNKIVANSLADYPIINGKAFIMISSYGSTGLRINEIGKETVKAWKTVYKNWDKTKDSINRELLFEYK
ncbi:hypothetical protein [Prochlorococcus marinus]|uniref:hypothetical protein n=1 Tax=Prochlorococcus marinus TaxID=1219 RepID=UPI001ADC34EC|nr:hypothetical protein [Prochlorococcus marinus]MBO8221288.1 hypothetical protein [Prochlorococcus marinus CUG1417]MBW3074106.1 hypothetical protein [Prochlorococcus marinus str. MU1417]